MLYIYVYPISHDAYFDPLLFRSQHSTDNCCAGGGGGWGPQSQSMCHISVVSALGAQVCRHSYDVSVVYRGACIAVQCSNSVNPDQRKRLGPLGSDNSRSPSPGISLRQELNCAKENCRPTNQATKSARQFQVCIWRNWAVDRNLTMWLRSFVCKRLQYRFVSCAWRSKICVQTCVCTDLWQICVRTLDLCMHTANNTSWPHVSQLGCSGQAWKLCWSFQRVSSRKSAGRKRPHQVCRCSWPVCWARKCTWPANRCKAFHSLLRWTSKPDQAVVLLSRRPFDTAGVQGLLEKSLESELLFQNDVYCKV